MTCLNSFTARAIFRTNSSSGFYKLTVFDVIFWGQIILIGCYLITLDKHHKQVTCIFPLISSMVTTESLGHFPSTFTPALIYTVARFLKGSYRPLVLHQNHATPPPPPHNFPGVPASSLKDKLQALIFFYFDWTFYLYSSSFFTDFP